MTSTGSLARFAGCLSWAILALLLLATVVADTLFSQSVRNMADRHYGFALFAWCVALILSAAHVLPREKPRILVVAFASLSSAAFFAWMGWELYDWLGDPMEQGRNGGMIPLIVICVTLCTCSLFPLLMRFTRH